MNGFNLIDNNKPTNLPTIFREARDVETLYQRLNLKDLMEVSPSLLEKSQLLKNYISRVHPPSTSNSTIFSIQAMALPLLNAGAWYMGYSTPATAYAVETTLVQQGFTYLHTIPVEQLIRERELIAEYIKINVINLRSVIKLFQCTDLHKHPANWCLLFDTFVPLAVEQALSTSECNELLIPIAAMVETAWANMPTEDSQKAISRKIRGELPPAPQLNLLKSYFKLLDQIWEKDKAAAKLMMHHWLPDEAFFLYDWWSKGFAKDNLTVLWELLSQPITIRCQNQNMQKKHILDYLSTVLRHQLICRYLQNDNDAIALLPCVYVFCKSGIYPSSKFFTIIGHDRFIKFLNNLTLAECHLIISRIFAIVSNKDLEVTNCPQYLKCLTGLMLKSEPEGLSNQNIELIKSLMRQLNGWENSPEKNQILYHLAELPTQQQGQIVPLIFCPSINTPGWSEYPFAVLCYDFNISYFIMPALYHVLNTPSDFKKEFCQQLEPLCHTKNKLISNGLFSAFSCFILPFIETEKNFDADKWKTAADFMFRLNPLGRSTKRYNDLYGISKVFAQCLFLSDGLLQLNPTAPNHPQRFFSIAAQLPLELQMVLCHRLYGSTKENIPTRDSEPAFKELAQSFTDN